MSPVIVSDTTTLIVLEKQNALNLLCQLFDPVLIPEVVYEEFCAGLKSGQQPLGIMDCFQVVAIESSSRVNNLKLLLDAGEAEAIELALTRQTPLIIDEKKGRQIARQLSLPITGFSGLLIMAVRKKILQPQEAVQSLNMAIQAGYRLSDSLYQQVIEMLEQ